MKLTATQKQVIVDRYAGTSPCNALRQRVIRALVEAGGQMPTVDLCRQLDLKPGVLDALVNQWCDVVPRGGNNRLVKTVRLGAGLSELLGLTQPGWRPRSPADLEALFTNCTNARLVSPVAVET